MEEHPQARLVVDTLTKAGFIAYYAGGWVRDFILGLPSDDIDIATNAPPETIQELFPKTVPIGISFGIVLVIVDGHQFEVATFRNDLDYKDGRRPSRVEYTTAEEDAKRRDFTVNGMFYDPIAGKVLDYVGGIVDLEQKVIRAIGNPHQRIAEDRLRMIRAIRQACKFHFRIDPLTAEAIRDHAKELFPAVAIERIVQELEKGRKSKKLPSILVRLHEFGLLATIFPALETASLEDVEDRLKAAYHFSAEIPTIAYLLELFPKLDLKGRLDLCKFLKLPNVDQEFTSFLTYAEGLAGKEPSVELVTWAKFYANKLVSSVLEIIAARLEQSAKKAFLQIHQERIRQLQMAIDRIRTQMPLVTSSDLLSAGIKPGKTMGTLLQEAERMSINQQIQDKKRILDILRQHPLWP